MKKNRYSKEYLLWLTTNAPYKSLNYLIKKSKTIWGYELSQDAMRNVLYKRGVKHRDYQIQHKTAQLIRPIGYEYPKSNGTIMVKTGPHSYSYKQRIIYEQHYNVKLTSKDMVIFLDGDRSNFDIDNLMRVSTAEYLYIRNKGLITGDREYTRTAILSARLHYKIKEIEK